jgi:HlyD family secretion protein
VLRLIRNRRVLLATALVAGLVAVALWPRPVEVDVVAVARGPLVMTVDEEGQTRVRDRYIVSAPVSGRVLRIELEPGDPVKRGQVVARVRAEAPPLLDARSRAEAQAAIDAAQAALERARAEEQRERANLAQAERELARVRELWENALAPRQQLDAREAEAKIAAQAVTAAVSAVRIAASELERARARVAPFAPEQAGRVVGVTAPATGVVLKRVRESESVVPAGDPLLEIGNPHELEVVADLLSTDAVRVRPHARALIEQWGGDRVLDARVRRVEPSGFTKISALGVEEQRVNVVLDFADPVSAWSALGDAYRVEVRIVVWEASDVVKVPTSALFRQNTDWAVYRLDDGQARLTPVRIDHQTDREAEVVSGLAEGTLVVEYPADTLRDGTLARVRR